MRILVRAPNWIGDQLMAYPFFHDLRQKYPQAHIAVVCVPWVESLQFRNLVDQVFVLHPPALRPKSLLSKFKQIESLAGEVRQAGKWDLAFCLPNSFGTAWFLKRAGCRRRVGYGAEGRGWLLSEARDGERAEKKHRSQAYRDLLYPASEPAPDVRDFWTLPADNELDPPISGMVDEFPAEAAWPHAQALPVPEEPYWVLAPGAVADSRRWGEEKFAALAREIARETGWAGVIVGGPKEAPIAERLKQDRSLKLKDWTARGPIVDLWALCRNARFTVANDSGMAHFAAICGSPVFVPWGAGDPRRTKPTGPTRIQIEVNAVECWPCEKNHCPLPGADALRCIRGVGVGLVWEQIRAGILKKPSLNAEIVSDSH